MKVIRKNLDLKDCGIVAAFNAASWCKNPHPYLVIRSMAKLSCKYKKSVGITNTNLDKLLNLMKLPVKKLEGKNMEEIESSIMLGKAVILTYKQTRSQEGHAVMVFLDKHGKIKILNPELELNGWNSLAAEIHAGAMDWVIGWELPHRGTIC